MRASESDYRSPRRDAYEVAWVPLDTAPGHLGLAMAPGRCEPAGESAGDPAGDPCGGVAANAGARRRWQRDLHADLRRLRHVHRCDVLVSILSDDELAWLGIADIAEAVAVHGIEHRRLQVRDGTAPAPEQEDEVLALVDDLRERLHAGRTVVLHCRAGQGRSGMLAALLVASLWELPADAIARVRRAQPRAVATVQQEHYVFDAAFAWFRRKAEAAG